MANIYQPKGSMCAVCVNNKLNCSQAMDFKFMPVMKQYSQENDDNVYKVVKCLMFNKENKPC